MLEVIVSAMDSGSAKLDDSIALFEVGVGLVKFCTGELDNAEQRVKILQAGEEGSLVEKDFAKPE